MATEAYFQENEGASLKSLKSISPPIDHQYSENGFDCNICLDSVQDPVITMCGHLYCWPCIYKWIHYQTTSIENSDDHQQPQCPVCKSLVSETTIIPLYGPGSTTKPSDEKLQDNGLVIPQRPPTPGCTRNSQPAEQLHHRSHPQSHHQIQSYPDGYRASGAIGTSVAHPTGGMYGEMVYGRIFGNSETTTVYTYPNSYHRAGSISPRVRRHIKEVDQSLSRLFFFLLCCLVLCLVLF